MRGGRQSELTALEHRADAWNDMVLPPLIRANSWASRPFIVAERERSSCKIRDRARSIRCDGCPEAPTSFVVVTKLKHDRKLCQRTT